MTEAQATMGLPRTFWRIHAELQAADKHYAALRDVAAEFYNLDTRPMVIFPDGRVERVGDFALPSELSIALQEAAIRVGSLRYEIAFTPQPALQ